MRKIPLEILVGFKNWNPKPHPMQHRIDEFRAITSLYHYKPSVERKVNLNSIEVGEIDTADHPDYCDAYIESAEYEDGTPLSTDDLEKLSEDRALIMEKIYDKL
jgi:hypothetical protein